MKKIAIRKASIDDLPQIVGLWTEFMRFHSDLDPYYSLSPEAENISKVHLYDRVNSPQSFVAVACLDEAIVGYCIACTREKPPVFKDRYYGHVTDIIVSKNYRGNKIGEELFSEVKQWFISEKIARVEVRTVTVNDLSNAFWERLGFKTFAEEKCLVLK